MSHLLSRFQSDLRSFLFFFFFLMNVFLLDGHVVDCIDRDYYLEYER